MARRSRPSTRRSRVRRCSPRFLRRSARKNKGNPPKRYRDELEQPAPGPAKRARTSPPAPAAPPVTDNTIYDVIYVGGRPAEDPVTPAPPADPPVADNTTHDVIYVGEHPAEPEPTPDAPSAPIQHASSGPQVISPEGPLSSSPPPPAADAPAEQHTPMVTPMVAPMVTPVTGPPGILARTTQELIMLAREALAVLAFNQAASRIQLGVPDLSDLPVWQWPAPPTVHPLLAPAVAQHPPSPHGLLALLEIVNNAQQGLHGGFAPVGDDQAEWAGDEWDSEDEEQAETAFPGPPVFPVVFEEF